MKIIFLTDTHIRGTNPRSRLDDFYQTLKRKFIEVSQIIEEYHIDYVLHGGDWFDRPDISPSIVREFAKIIKSFNRPVYSVAGNHDIYGHNPETLSRTMLGLLEGTEIINILRYNQPVILEKNGIKLQLYGNSYNYDIDAEKSNDFYIVKKKNNVNYCINMVHGMLLPNAFIEGIKYTLVDDILSTEADITLAGHYHSGFGIKKIGEKYFVNPGSLARISSLKSEITRDPSIVIIELEKNIEIFMYKLKTAESGDKVLNREHIEMHQNRSFKLNQFFQGIDASGDYEHTRIDLNRIIEEIASSQNLSSQVKLETIKRIEKARTGFSGEEVDS